MFDKIIAYSIRQKFIVGLMVIVLVGMGIYSLNKLPIDALPDITNNQVQILTPAPNLATQEVELFITYPIELAVKSIPRIVELRSISRFGLSIVTVVFEESADIYWARAQISERLKEVTQEIPPGFGRSEMAPISTGLGEIYQYTVSAEEGYEEQFNTMELRSIQDWIIVPQLLGTKGVAEVNTLGGVLKEYEVAVNPDKLNSMGITMHDIYEALSQNNQNTGGAYIDKRPYMYFIRGVGMVNSLDDVNKIVITNRNNVPVLVRDVAEVKFGSAVRYGATTRDGKGEVVNGMVMMLKGANSAEIIALVKDKMEQIKATLPEGVSVTPYLDRSKLVGRAIATVRTNLIEGALIVIFILVLLIGNWRAGLIVATVIPLSLLFAVSMMRLFGVSGNLMSLGAIDFGLIVDGAVILVEAIVHRLQSTSIIRKLTPKEMDKEVYAATSKIRNSAAFGEMIILIVYLPILALVGIEGKMFKPMAQTVAFAILGAFLLSLTYIPMMSAVFLNKTTGHKKNVSDRIIAFFQQLYSPVLKAAMRAKWVVLVLAIALFGLALNVFDSLGGEFIPTLSEGDIATHVIIPPGSSLQQEIHSTTKAEQLLLKNFPEIEQVVSKIGSAEVPTDPMPIEVADVMVILKDKKEWTSAGSKKEMFEKMEEVLDELPGVTTEFSQPIQMRFNELMTGIRSDVGVKIFGEDIDLLLALGEEAEGIISSVPGIVNCRAETVSGLPQIVIRYNKDLLALYGLHVGDLNETVSMGFAGRTAGMIYEGEKKYKLVIRLAEEFRQDIEQVKNLYITLPSGSQVPLEEVAEIKYERGPTQISREDGKRRIIVGFNVRGRDVETVVEDIQKKLEAQLELPAGYYITYAGQFENLQRANQRLIVAVPIALSLIFILLFFTFNSVLQSLLIFTAIPLSAIGGVFALWIRGMPFSISAGIGFIALFGVAVLNGIVLIAYFNQLKKEGMTNIIERIHTGTRVRLRPVLMTAAVASLGFLPMALSTSAGAEVQKPLATVVIGGLITATLLTLIVLPILYYYAEKGLGFIKDNRYLAILLALCVASSSAYAQPSGKLTLSDAIQSALAANKSLKATSLSIQKHQQLKVAPYLLPNTEVSGSFGQVNNHMFDHSYSISQQFNPFISKAAKASANAQYELSKLQYESDKQEIIFRVRQAWDALQYYHTQLDLLKEQQAVWQQFLKYAERQYELGESSLREKTEAELSSQKIELQIAKTSAESASELLRLKTLLNTKNNLDIPYQTYAVFDQITAFANPVQNHQLKIAAQEVQISKAQQQLYAAERKPAFAIGYFIQSFQGELEVDGEVIDYDLVPRFHGVDVGVSIPIFRKGHHARSQAAQTDIAIGQAKLEQLGVEVQNELDVCRLQLKRLQSDLAYYQNSALPNAARMVASAEEAYKLGDIGYQDYVQSLQTRFAIQTARLHTIKAYNNQLFVLLYLLNK